METPHLKIIKKECEVIIKQIIEENSNRSEKYQFFMLMATLDSIEWHFNNLKDRLVTKFSNENIEVNKRELQQIIMGNAKKCIDSLMRVKGTVNMG